MNIQKNYQNKPFFLKGANGTGVLLLHGWTSPPDEFLPLAKYLNSFGYTIYAPLLRGHGTKPEDLLGVTWKDWLEDSREALEELKKYLSLTTGVIDVNVRDDITHSYKRESVVRDETRIFVGGISMGGNLAILLSKDESVAGIVSLGTPIKFHFQTLAKIGLFFIGLLKTYRKKYYPPWVRKKMGNRKVYLTYPVANAKEVARLSEATEKFLPRVRKPILIMQSTTDHLVSKRSPKIIFEKVASKTKEISWVKDGYHVFVDKKEVYEKIKEFISRIIP